MLNQMNPKAKSPSWFSSLTDRQINLLGSFGISSDESYLNKRDTLPEKELSPIDDLRFLNWSASVSSSTETELLKYLPKRFGFMKDKLTSQTKGEKLGNLLSNQVAALTARKNIEAEIKKSPSGNLLIEQVKSHSRQIFGRDAVIWRGRMGLMGKRLTLEEVGASLGLTRERVRQVEHKLFEEFSSQYDSCDEILASLIKLDSDQPIYLTTLINENPKYLNNIETDIDVLDGLLETMTPKHYVIRNYSEVVISKLPRTKFEAEVRNVSREIEKVFRKSEMPLSRDTLTQKLIDAGFHHIFVRFAVEHTEKVGHYRQNLLLSPDSNYSNIVIGVLQQSDSPVHINELAAQVAIVSKEEYVNPASLRGTLTLAPIVRNFGRGLMGLPKHKQVDFKTVLELNGKPMPEQYLIKIAANGDEDISRFNLLLNTDVFEVGNGVWGLVERDSPYNHEEINSLHEVFENQTQLNRDQVKTLIEQSGMIDHGLEFRDIVKLLINAQCDEHICR
jgi:hypothetical protein